MNVFVLLCLLSLAGLSQEWPYYGGDAGGRRYSPLKQINRSNISRLKVAWTFHTGDLSDGKSDPIRSAFEATPLMIDGVLYFTTPFNRLLAIDAETGRQLWAFDPKLRRDVGRNLYIHRGVAYWTDGKQKRLYYGTLDGDLFAIDATTGQPVSSFGVNGKVSLREGMMPVGGRGSLGMSSPPAIYKNLVICGSIVSDGEPQGPSGDVRAFDALTGKLAWRFHTVPRPGEFGNDTWEGESWKGRGGVNAWSILSVDLQRGIVFLPLTSPSTDFYGGDRKGANLFGDSLVALDAMTGKRLWHFQTVHHNLWDYDLPAQPVLVEVQRNGRLVPAVAQVTKMGFTFLFERETGKPLFEIVERPVPPSEIPGEQAWPTQPFPVKPPPFARQSMTREELTTIPESREFCEKLVEGAVFGSLYTPIGRKPTILFPGTNGGANWGGASFDPETRTLYVNSHDNGMIFRMVERPPGSQIPFRPQGPPFSRFWDKNRYPCQRPPWGHLTAIDLDRGEHRWRVTLGVFDELLAKGIPPTGASNLGGSIVTAGGLVFIGATNDSRFRAFDKDTGKELWVYRLPASAHATPITFYGKKTKKQYVVIAAGGGNKYNETFSDALIAFALP
ncbi:MAG: pyrroloquinoline quinone-dependent dehydrogenase [Bryobacteraceae bacterium]|nr:pyrroloquinoline quinone-dependent dehydrogenase [Bryobacteraceae bacterium]MDW8380461.1 pyrroloquinoline quinone-dependent dehydrogenase [Bryobacterales bacterium]